MARSTLPVFDPLAELGIRGSADPSEPPPRRLKPLLREAAPAERPRAMNLPPAPHSIERATVANDEEPSQEVAMDAPGASLRTPAPARPPSSRPAARMPLPSPRRSR